MAEARSRGQPSGSPLRTRQGSAGLFTRTLFPPAGLFCEALRRTIGFSEEEEEEGRRRRRRRGFICYQGGGEAFNQKSFEASQVAVVSGITSSHSPAPSVAEARPTPPFARVSCAHEARRGELVAVPSNRYVELDTLHFLGGLAEHPRTSVCMLSSPTGGGNSPAAPCCDARAPHLCPGTTREWFMERTLVQTISGPTVICNHYGAKGQTIDYRPQRQAEVANGEP